MNTHYTIAEVATFFGVSEAAIIRELESLPHTKHGLDITFSEEQFQSTRQILDADPTEQLGRLVALEQIRRETEAEEEAASTFNPEECEPWCSEHVDGSSCTSEGLKFTVGTSRSVNIEFYAQQDPALPSQLMCLWGNELSALTPAEAARIGQGLLDQASLFEAKKL